MFRVKCMNLNGNTVLLLPKCLELLKIFNCSLWRRTNNISPSKLSQLWVCTHLMNFKYVTLHFRPVQGNIMKQENKKIIPYLPHCSGRKNCKMALLVHPPSLQKLHCVPIMEIQIVSFLLSKYPIREDQWVKNSAS